MRRPIAKLVAVCLLLLVVVSPRPSVDRTPPPLISPSASPQFDWSIIRTRLDELALFYSSLTPPPRPARRRGAVGPLDGDRFDRLALCESGGDPAKNTGNGFYGAFQWLLSTWHAAGGTGNPIEHSYAEQKQIAMSWALVADPYTQWPVCWPRSA